MKSSVSYQEMDSWKSGNEHGQEFWTNRILLRVFLKKNKCQRDSAARISARATSSGTRGMDREESLSFAVWWELMGPITKSVAGSELPPLPSARALRTPSWSGTATNCPFQAGRCRAIVRSPPGRGWHSWMPRKYRFEIIFRPMESEFGFRGTHLGTPPPTRRWAVGCGCWRVSPTISDFRTGSSH